MMKRTLKIPHQRVEFDTGEEGTVRATLTTLPDGRARGRLALAMRGAARRYRAICGTIHEDDRDQGLRAALQLEGLATRDGIGELAELRLSDAGEEEPGMVEVTLRRLPDGDRIASFRAQLATA